MRIEDNPIEMDGDDLIISPSKLVYLRQGDMCYGQNYMIEGDQEKKDKEMEKKKRKNLKKKMKKKEKRLIQQQKQLFIDEGPSEEGIINTSDFSKMIREVLSKANNK